jgi:hypothetical protein
VNQRHQRPPSGSDSPCRRPSTRRYPRDRDGESSARRSVSVALSCGTVVEIVPSSRTRGREVDRPVGDVLEVEIDDRRRERGNPEHFTTHHDWTRKESELTGEWTDRDRWVEYADDQRSDDHGMSDDAWAALRHEELDWRFEAYITDEEIEHREQESHERLGEHLEDEVVLERAREIEAERQSAEASD